ncbi:hypothetical protein GPJ56_009411 [Histomonas meleagridis]|uniref:uncharacterized protein n=1 Tax=Histomonas meleagridis TaxID=135588 RepID=UPI003559EC22|nr:hypothetical protein GPJ56_009411 [Histomonas meleagridis]KAH0797485.1 hypothetical protein GO595_009806 [Histomonas meleagridis]
MTEIISKDYSFTAKIIMIGAHFSGKTCIVRSFFGKEFLGTGPTIGVEFYVKYVDIEGEKIKLQIWDTSGQEKFRSITSCYYRNADGILLVFDLSSRDSFEQVGYWMNSIRNNCENFCNVILVGNKCDLERLISEEEAKEEAANYQIPYIETSAKDNINIEKAFMEIASMVVRSKHTCTLVNEEKPQPQKLELNDEKKECC